MLQNSSQLTQTLIIFKFYSVLLVTPFPCYYCIQCQVEFNRFLVYLHTFNDSRKTEHVTFFSYFLPAEMQQEAPIAVALSQCCNFKDSHWFGKTYVSTDLYYDLKILDSISNQSMIQPVCLCLCLSLTAYVCC